MTRTIRIILWILCVSIALAVLTGKHGAAPLFVSIAMIAFLFVVIWVIVQIIKSL